MGKQKAHGTRGAASASRPIDVLLVCSAGGHLMQLHLLRNAWEAQGLRSAWVTIPMEDARTLLADEDVAFAHSPTTRSIKNLALNTLLAWRIIRSRRPQVIVTTGAGVAVPFAWIGKILGVSTVYIESLTRIERPSLSCRLIRPVAERLYAQWPELAGPRYGLTYVGRVIGE